MTTEWPSNADFDKKREKAIKWADLPNNIYKIRDTEEKRETKYGRSVIITLINKSNKQIRVFAPDRMLKDLDDKKFNFIRNEGKVKSSSTGNDYFSFTLI